MLCFNPDVCSDRRRPASTRRSLLQTGHVVFDRGPSGWPQVADRCLRASFRRRAYHRPSHPPPRLSCTRHAWCGLQCLGTKADDTLPRAADIECSDRLELRGMCNHQRATAGGAPDSTRVPVRAATAAVRQYPTPGASRVFGSRRWRHSMSAVRQSAPVKGTTVRLSVSIISERPSTSTKSPPAASAMPASASAVAGTRALPGVIARRTSSSHPSPCRRIVSSAEASTVTAPAESLIAPALVAWWCHGAAAETLERWRAPRRCAPPERPAPSHGRADLQGALHRLDFRRAGQCGQLLGQGPQATPVPISFITSCMDDDASIVGGEGVRPKIGGAKNRADDGGV